MIAVGAAVVDVAVGVLVLTCVVVIAMMVPLFPVSVLVVVDCSGPGAEWVLPNGLQPFGRVNRSLPLWLP